MNFLAEEPQNYPPESTQTATLAEALHHFGSKILLKEHSTSLEWASVCRAAEEGLDDVVAVGLEVFLSHLGSIYTASEKLLLHTVASLVRARRYRTLYRLVGFLDRHGRTFSPARAA